MTTLNKYAFLIANKYHINSLTDVTGFSLIGHSYEMAKGSNVSINLFSNDINYFNASLEFANMGFIPEGTYRNKKWTKGNVNINNNISGNLIDIMYSPETSGGLLISKPKNDALKCLETMKAEHIDACLVGERTEKNRFYINIL